MVDGFTRIDGWKAIAAHFRRDRSTVIRWAASGDFPVHRVAGRRSGSVWAYAHELDAWLARTGVDMVADRPPEFGTEVALPTTGTDPAPPTARRKVGRNTLNVACGALLLAGAFAMLLARVSSAPPVHNRTLPGDATTADLYLQARDDLSTRTPASLRKASAEFAAVISRDPGFAPAYAGLADTYVLAPEFIGTPSDVALAKAEAATKAALAIDPDSADANRALGFIDYWWRGDIRTARDHFGRSLRSDPNSAQTHFWYGNILIDVGEAEDGLRELRAARLLDPGSWAIQADYAFALWCRGPGDPGLRDLEDLTAEDPKLGSAHRYLSLIFLAKGDIPAYLDENQKLAAVVGDKSLTVRAEAERRAFESRGAAGVFDLIEKGEPASAQANARATEWRATAASLLGRRAQLLDLMTRAERNGEHWRTWRWDQIRFAKWRGDSVVMTGLERLGAVPPAPPISRELATAGG